MPDSPAATRLERLAIRALGRADLPALRTAGDRRTVAFRHAGRRYVLKRYGREAARERWYGRFRRAARAPVALREAANLRAVRAAGIGAPEPLAAGLSGAGRGGWILMTFVPHDEHLATRLSRAREPGRLQLLARQVARLHGLGWYHRDLYCTQVLPVAPDGGDGLTILDFGRARHEPRPRLRWRIKDLAALHASAPQAVSRTDRLRFLDRWLCDVGPRFGGYATTEGPARQRRRRRRLVRAVVARARRLRDHRPRHPEPTLEGFPEGAPEVELPPERGER